MTVTATSAVEKFHDWYVNRHEYAKKWKERTGGMIMGCFCSYVPEELMYAAGILPVRILGSHEPPDIADAYIFGMFCPFCRDVLAQGLKGRFHYLDGIVLSQSCLHLRQSFTSWQKHVPIPYSYYLYMPNKVQSPSAKPYLKGELANFQRSLEEFTGKTVTPETLDYAVEVHNENRRLLRKIYETRRAENPPMTGLEAMEMVASAEMVDKAEHNGVLKEFLKELPDRKLDRETGIRLMLVGSEDDDTTFVKMVESVGGTIVVDDHCTGSRYFWNEVVTNDDRLAALAARYCDRPACPTKDWEERTRFPHILKLAKDYGVQGVILVQQKFCDPHECDIPPLRWFLQENGIPSLTLEFDVTVPMGQFRIRVEAFLEMIRGEDLF